MDQGIIPQIKTIVLERQSRTQSVTLVLPTSKERQKTLPKHSNITISNCGIGRQTQSDDKFVN